MLKGNWGFRVLLEKQKPQEKRTCSSPCVCVSVCVCVRSSSKDLVMLSETGIFGMWFSIASR